MKDTLEDELMEDDEMDDDGGTVVAVSGAPPKKGFGMKRLEYLGAKAGVEDVPAFMRFLRAGIEYCQDGDDE